MLKRKYTIQCDHPETGLTGCWLFKGDTHREPNTTMSPVFKDLAMLFTWFKLNGWSDKLCGSGEVCQGHSEDKGETINFSYIGAPNAESASPTPMSNWFYRWGELHTDHGIVRTASHASTIRSYEGWEDYGKRKLGQTVGFGKYPEDIVNDFSIGTFEFQPSGEKVRLKEDCRKLLANTINLKGRRPDQGYTSGELKALAWLKENAGREFDLSMTIPQWTRKQFVSTMPTDDSEGGFVLANGLVEFI